MTRLQIQWVVIVAIITPPSLRIKLVLGERVLLVILTGNGYGYLPPCANVALLSNLTLACTLHDFSHPF